MALVAVQDWPDTMDNRQQRPSLPNSPVNSNDRDAPQQAPYPAQPPYGYPQPWSMPVNGVQPHPNGFYPAMQYFPSHYQHPPPHQAQPSPFPQQPYFDPNAQAQFAQWAQAYQQMMYNVHQSQLVQPQQQPQQSQPPSSQTSQQSHSLRSRSGSHSTSPPVPMEYYAQQQPQNFAPQRFPAGTPPPNAQYQGFHPYRRPDRPNERDRPRHRDANNQPTTPPAFQPPYARQDAAGSSSSVNSASGSNSSHRSRTESGNSSERAIAARVNGNSNTSAGHNARSKSSSSSSLAPQQPQQPHHQRVSSNASSTASSIPRSSASSSAASNSSSNVMGSSLSGTTQTARTQRPSPLSQASTPSTAERRMSRDDSDIDAMLAAQHASSHSGPISGPRSSGLKSRIRRVLSFNAAQALKEEDEDEGTPNAKSGSQKDKAKETAATPSTPGEDASSTAGKKPKKSRAASMFNARFNASTDNISLSSTVSSASVMIRKLGSMGRLARRNSLAGITSLFKDKDKDKDKGKAGKAEASVTLATAEVDRSSHENGATFEGLSPAAALVRQHTLKSNAEAAARAKEQAEAQAAADAKKDADLPITWERNTASRQGGSVAHLNNPGNISTVREDGVRVVVEDDSDSDDGRPSAPNGAPQSPGSVGSDSDEDGTWRGHGEEEDDEDVTIRIGLEKNGISNDAPEEDGDSMDESWAINIRRSAERNRRPTKGILKYASEYAQSTYLESPNPAFAHSRVRANSYDSVPMASTEPGPLARIPSPDPDHIDGLHKHGPHNSASSGLLGPLPFESQISDSPSSTSSPPLPDKSGGLFSQPGLNSSAPALSTMHNTSGSSALAHRSQTAPSKRLTFATNLSIYDTFSSSAYDRRSEPATWSRLTPALAQRIKEELNSYKMEEMEVHASSRIHTQFFV